MNNTVHFASGRKRFPAEWEQDGAVLLAWPHAATDWSDMLSEVQECYVDMIRAIVPYQKVVVISPDTSTARDMLENIDPARIYFVDVPTNDTWTRDYGPLTIMDIDGEYKALDFCFNGWGMKFAACHDNLVNARLKEKLLISVPLVNCRDFVLEGGAIESDGNGSLMTTSLCLLSHNRNDTLSRAEIEHRLFAEFGVRQILWVEHGYLAGDDTDGHIDTLARFAPHGSIVYVGCDNPDDEHYAALKAMKEDIQSFTTPDGRPFNLFELPLPDPIYDPDGERLPATYANFLATPQVVIMPVYGQPQKDMLARQILTVAFARPVVTVDCRALIRQHGSLHCATMQIPGHMLAL